MGLDKLVDLFDTLKYASQGLGKVQIIIHGIDKSLPDVINNLINFRERRTFCDIHQRMQAGIQTNMPFEDGLKLAVLMRDIPFDQIQTGVIDDHMVNFGNVTLGGQNAAVLLPIPDKIRELRDKIFTTSGPTSPIAQGDPTALMQADGARVQVTNNTYTASLDQRTGNFLLSQGMQVTGIGAPTGVSDTTVVVLHSPKLYTLRYLINPLGMIASSNQIIFAPDANLGVDLEIRLGNDWVSKLPPGY